MMDDGFDAPQMKAKAYLGNANQSKATTLDLLCSGSEELAKLARQVTSQLEDMLSRLSGPVCKPGDSAGQTTAASTLSGALGAVDTRLTIVREQLNESLQIIAALSRHI